MLVTPALLLFAALMLGVLGTQHAQAHASTFPDVAETDKAHEAIQSLADRNILSGDTDGRFNPLDPITRAQATKTLVLWRDVNPIASASLFADVPDQYKAYVATASAKGWISGFPDGTFQPERPLTRQQMATLMIRTMGLEQQVLRLAKSQIAATLGRFLDGVAVSDGARPYLALAVEKNLFNGEAGRLNPNASITRAQFSLVLYRAERLISNTGALTTDESSTTPETTTETTVLQSASYTAQEEALASFMDMYLFRPHNSPVTGLMVLQNAEWYGIPPLAQLVIMAAETSLGDPRLGGIVARHFNFGCMRYHGTNNAWGPLSNGRIWAAGKDWYSFPSAQAGMVAWGRYLKAGVNGAYLPILKSSEPNWERFASIYYGRGVSGFSSYVARLNSIENRFRSLAVQHGVKF